MKLQHLVDQANDTPFKPLPPTSFDSSIDNLYECMEDYKAAMSAIDNDLTLETSDMKKMLSLPFLMAKRHELPEPKAGQKEWSIFSDLYGKTWDHYEGLVFDPEEKITEFTWEKHYPETLTRNLDTKSEDFKKLIQATNFFTHTEYEQHKRNQTHFKELMPILVTLDQREAESFLHLLRNKGRTMNNVEARTNTLIDSACSDQVKKEMA